MLRFMSCCAVLDDLSVSPRKWHIFHSLFGMYSQRSHSTCVWMSVFMTDVGDDITTLCESIFDTNGIDKHEQNDNLLHRPIGIRWCQFLYLNFTTVTFWHYINFNKYCDLFCSKTETSLNDDYYPRTIPVWHINCSRLK